MKYRYILVNTFVKLGRPCSNIECRVPRISQAVGEKLGVCSELESKSKFCQRLFKCVYLGEEEAGIVKCF